MPGGAETMLMQLMANGLVLGSIYALLALGFVIIFKATEVVNFAQGEMMVIAVYVMYMLIVGWKINVALALVIGVLVTMGLGVILERFVIRRMLGEPVFAIILVTFGLSFILRSATGIAWSFQDRTFPQILPGGTRAIMGLKVSNEQIWLVTITLLLVLVLSLFFKYTRLGTAMRATSQNQYSAYLVGISIKKVFSQTWAISSLVAAITGVLVCHVVFMHPTMGFISIKAFPAAILGGFNSIPGAVVGGFIIGLSENIAGAYLSPGFKDVFPYIMLIGILVLKPEGIFGRKEKKKV